MALPDLVTGTGGLPQASASPSYPLIWDGTIWRMQGGVLSEDSLAAAFYAQYLKVKTGGFRAQQYAQTDRFATIPITAYTAGTPQTILTPASGKKWVTTAGTFVLSVSGQLIIKSAGVEVWRSQNATAITPPPGIVALAANDTLQLDTTASGNISGWMGVYEC